MGMSPFGSPVEDGIASAKANYGIFALILASLRHMIQLVVIKGNSQVTNSKQIHGLVPAQAREGGIIGRSRIFDDHGSHQKWPPGWM